MLVVRSNAAIVTVCSRGNLFLLDDYVWLLGDGHGATALLISPPQVDLPFCLIVIKCLALEFPIWPEKQLILGNLLLAILLFYPLRRPVNVNTDLNLLVQVEFCWFQCEFFGWNAIRSSTTV